MDAKQSAQLIQSAMVIAGIGSLIQINVNAIISVTLIFLVSAIETIGDTSALAVSGLGREVTTKETAGSIACDGYVSALSSVFGCT